MVAVDEGVGENYQQIRWPEWFKINETLCNQKGHYNRLWPPPAPAPQPPPSHTRNVGLTDWDGTYTRSVFQSKKNVTVMINVWATITKLLVHLIL